MADYAPPTGPPPPKLPEGWKAVWNDQYSEWFFVNIYTKKSQWDKPTEPVYPLGEAPLDNAPPSYPGAQAGGIGTHTTGTSEKSALSSNNPYASGAPGANNMTEDEKLARKLQEEEEARARSHGLGAAGDRGASNEYYNQSGQQHGGYPQQQQYPQQSASPYPQSQTPYNDSSAGDRGSSKGKGLVGKLLGKVAGGKSSSSHGYPQQSHYGGQPGYYQQPGQPMMGGPMMGGPMGGGGRRPGGGMGAGGAMALGAGGGLLGGALLGSAMADGGDGGDTYVENNYGDDGDYGGGDMGGDMGDMGGGDF